MSDETKEALMALEAESAHQQQDPKEVAMAEALKGVETNVELARPKFPAGMTLVGIMLTRNKDRAGQRMEAIGRDWQATGLAIALRNGHVVAGNPVFGRWTNGVPKVSAMHWCICAKCGRRVPMPLAVWEAKDAARRLGKEIPKEQNGKSVLDKYGSCPCGAKWSIDDKGEKVALTEFADQVLKALEDAETVPKYLPPAAFTVGKAGDVDQGWLWLKEAMAKAGKPVAPFAKDDRGDVIIYNPGLWIGYIDDYNRTNLFWVENGKGKDRHHAPAFNPASVDGL